MKTLRLILGDQLSRDVSSLRELDPDQDVVLLVEVAEETTYVRHHKQKIVLILSAMRHFAAVLRNDGVEVDYVDLNDPHNTGSFTGELQRAVARHRPDRVAVTEPGEYRVWEAMQGWPDELGVELDVFEDDRFLCSLDAFRRWADGRKIPRMEYFYREMRRCTGWLMEGDRPIGGRWNYDDENRRALPRDVVLPDRLRFRPDAVTRKVMDLVAERFADHFGDLERFGWAVTSGDARRALAHFVADGLPRFGAYQDAMPHGAPFVYHAVLSPYLNLGLLDPREVCEAALAAYDEGAAPLPAVEGFVRQILGWREFVRGTYWLHMPDYAKSNALDARRPLPDFYWTGETRMRCLRDTVENTRRHAYAHHIQRLMLTGNFALLAGLAPAEVEAWYLAVYADAFEWVELPNTHGMALYADGGLLGSKPYAASGAYIDRMSDYCGACAYRPKVKSGPEACPFNYLYWHFLMTKQERLGDHPRLAMPYRTLARMSDARRQEIAADADRFFARLEKGKV